jgi:hypothetical protein
MSNLLINTRVDVEVPDQLMIWLVQFSDFAATAKMGLTCTLCQGAIVSKGHGLHDEHLTMSCGCREFKGVNPLRLLEKRKLEKQTEALKDGTADLPVH